MLLISYARLMLLIIIQLVHAELIPALHCIRSIAQNKPVNNDTSPRGVLTKYQIAKIKCFIRIYINKRLNCRINKKIKDTPTTDEELAVLDKNNSLKHSINT
jgi:hypothetical protein